MQSNYRKIVERFLQGDHEDGTYSIYSGVPVTYADGYQVSFEREGVKIEDSMYDQIINLMVVTTASAPHIGIYKGTKEISFHVKDLNKAIALGIIFSQESIWDWKNNRALGVK
jgi:hypothetical protein